MPAFHSLKQLYLASPWEGYFIVGNDLMNIIKKSLTTACHTQRMRHRIGTLADDEV
jgi:hypothetical protein